MHYHCRSPIHRGGQRAVVFRGQKKRKVGVWKVASGSSNRANGLKCETDGTRILEDITFETRKASFPYRTNTKSQYLAPWSNQGPRHLRLQNHKLRIQARSIRRWPTMSSSVQRRFIDGVIGTTYFL